MKPLSRALLVGIVSVAVTSLQPITASAATLTVNQASDPGDGVCDSSCTLRDAILAADQTAEPDTIVFDVSGGGNPVVIDVETSELPAIDQPLTIDGFSDPDSSRVELHDATANAGATADGLSINGADITVKGMVIRNFGNDGIDISATATGIRIESSLIGTDASGTVDQGNGGNGVQINGAANVIGGSGLGNLISGNGQTGNGSGISISGSGANANTVQGNFIGTRANGAGPSIPNDDHGIVLTSSARDNLIGGSSAAVRNIVSGNGQDGIRAQGAATTNSIQGNFIGTDASGAVALPNSADGVGLRQSTSGNIVGGTAVGAGNVVSGNTDDGIQVGTTADPTPTKNAILGNSVSGNGSLGIDLQGLNAVDSNDAGDGDVGSNNLQNFPVLTSVFSATRVAINGTLNSAASKQYRIEFFSNAGCDPLGFGEGQTFLGATTAVTDGAGNASFSVSLPTPVGVGQPITATATDPDNNTSEFSQCRAVAADTAAPSTPTTDPDGGTFQTGTTFTVTWSTSTDNLTGIFGYDVRYREAPYNGGFGTHVNWQNAAATKALATTTATSATFTGTPGSTYCFSARAIDGAGNASPYGAEGCTAIPVDNPTFKHRGRWAKKTGDGYYLNTFSRTKQEGARLTLGVQATVLSIIVTKCRRCGTIKVFFRGKLLKKIRLRTPAATRQKLRFVTLKTFASPQAGTVRVRVVSKGKLVIVEGLAVSAV